MHLRFVASKYIQVFKSFLSSVDKMQLVLWQFKWQHFLYEDYVKL